MIGPGKAFDTDRFFVVCSNVLGGCSGSTGPTSINPQTGLPYGTSFPIISIGDIVAAQYKLLRALGVNSLAAVSGASMGGQQALQWLISYPDFVRSAVPIACAASLSALGLGLMEVSREAIMSDPEWRSGDYIGQSFPENGLRLARMIAHLSYVSSQFLDVEFGRRLAEDSAKSEALEAKFAIQKYLRDEGDHFIKRFDPNTFLYLSQAIEHFDLTQNVPSLAAAFERVKGRVLLLSFRTDLLFPVSGLRELETSLRDAKVDVDHITVETSFGHDAFLTDWMKISPLIAEFLR
jgi:homoserine O-acetyltransferase